MKPPADGRGHSAVPVTAYSVIFDASMDAVPADVNAGLRHSLADIGAVLETVPDWSAFWLSMRDSELQVDVKGWRFRYRVDPSRRELRVVQAAEARTA